MEVRLKLMAHRLDPHLRNLYQIYRYLPHLRQCPTLSPDPCLDPPQTYDQGSPHQGLNPLSQDHRV